MKANPVCPAVGGTTVAAGAACPPLLDHQVPALMGGKLNLCEYSGKAVVVVNTASECGFTPAVQEPAKAVAGLPRQRPGGGGFPQ